MKPLMTFATLTLVCLSTTLARSDDKPAVDTKATAAGTEARMHFRHARDTAETLLYRFFKQVPTSAEEASGILSAVDRDINSGVKALDQFATHFSNNAEVVQQIDLIKKQSAKVLSTSAMLAKDSQKQQAGATMTDAAANVWNGIDAVETQTTGLLKQLKVVRWDPAAALAKSATEGTKVGGFLPQTSAVYLKSINENARVIDQYANANGTVPDAAILQHVDEVTRQLEALKKEYAKLDEEYRKAKGLEAGMKSMETQQAQLQQTILQLRQTSKTRPLNPTELRQLSESINRSLSTSLNHYYQVMGTPVAPQQRIIEDFPYSN